MLHDAQDALAPLAPAILAMSAELESSALVWMVGALGFFVLIGTGLNGWVSLWQYFTGKRPDLSKLATRQELAALEQELRREHQQDLQTFKDSNEALIAAVKDELGKMGRDLREVFGELRSLHRALGRTEGELEAVTTPPPKRRRASSAKS